jgi:hypothetical protein
MDQDEFEWAPGAAWFVDYDDAPDRCTEMVLRSLRARSPQLREAYMHAAEWFALSVALRNQLWYAGSVQSEPEKGQPR